MLKWGKKISHFFLLYIDQYIITQLFQLVQDKNSKKRVKSARPNSHDIVFMSKQTVKSRPGNSANMAVVWTSHQDCHSMGFYAKCVNNPCDSGRIEVFLCEFRFFMRKQRERNQSLSINVTINTHQM